MKPAIILTLFR